MASIREPKPSDVQRLAELLVYTQALHVEAFPDIYKPMSSQVAVDHIHELLRQEIHLRVAEVDGVVAGYTCFEIRQLPESVFAHPRRHCYLNQVTVDPRFQKRGIGATLIGDMFAIGTQHEISRYELDVWGFNDTAKRFFTSQGFQIFGTRMARVAT